MMTVRSYSRRLVRGVLPAVAAMALGLLIAQQAQAELEISAPDLVIVTDGSSEVTGSFDVVLNATGGDIGAGIGSFNVGLSTSDASVSLGSPAGEGVAPSVAPLFNAGTLLNFSASEQQVLAAQDVFPGSAPAFDGAGLIGVNFSIPAGLFGNFDLTFDQITTLLTDDQSAPLAFSLSNGSISVQQVPEPSSIALCLLVGLVAVGVTRRRK